MYNDNRINDLNKTYIRTNLWDQHRDIGIVIFDINEPLYYNQSRYSNIYLEDYTNDNVVIKIKYDATSGLLLKVIPDDNTFLMLKALNISRQYRPGFGRYSSAVYTAIIAKFYNKTIGSESLSNVRFPMDVADCDIDDLINIMIGIAWIERHPDVGETDHSKKRFILIPYSASMRTWPISLTGTGHFVTLIIDLDHKNATGDFVPFVYVYDSAHMFCRYYGQGTSALNKDSYFKFDKDTIIDDYPLNSDVNYCVCFYIPNSISSKIQYVFRADCRCGYYCEAAINLLLEDSKIIDNDGGGLVPGEDTRKHLKGLLTNFKVLNKIAEIKPPSPQPS